MATPPVLTINNGIKEKPPLPPAPTSEGGGAQQAPPTSTKSRFSKWSRLFSRKDFFSWQRSSSSEKKKAQTWSSKDNNSPNKKKLFEQLTKLKHQQQHLKPPHQLQREDTSHYFVDSKAPKPDVNSNFPVVGDGNIRQQKFYRTLGTLEKKAKTGCSECRHHSVGATRAQHQTTGEELSLESQ